MKRKIKLIGLERHFAAALMLLAASCAWAQDGENAAPPPPQRVAVVDMQAAFDQLDEKKAIEQEQRAQIELLQIGKRERAEEVKGLEEELMLLADGPGRDVKQDALIEKAAHLEAWMKLQQRRVTTEVKLKLEGMQRKMLDAIEAVAQEEGYDLVISKQAQLNLPPAAGQQVTSATSVMIVLFASDRADITPQIIARMNNDYNNAVAVESGAETQ